MIRHRLYVFIALIFFAPAKNWANSSADGACDHQPQKIKKLFEHSTISLMYNESDLKRLADYNADMVTWGNHIENSRQSISKQTMLFEKYEKLGLKLYASDIALIQEGGKYAVCGSKWNPECNKYFWKLRDNHAARAANLQNIDGIRNRAALSSDGRIAGVPWLSKKGSIVPMACASDPGYKKWLFEKIDTVLSVRPKVLHFDEPWMDLATINAHSNHGCFTNYCLSDLQGFIAKNPESNLTIPVDSLSESIDHKFYINRLLCSKSKSDLLLENKFYRFKKLSTLKLFSELADYAKAKSISPLLITANVSPDNWSKLGFIQYLDFLSPEINHNAAKLTVPDAPILAYLMADAMDISLFSTAFGTDWAIIKSGGHEILACAWIAQAYATGQFMNFPSQAWVPGSVYRPNTDIYPRLSSWIKDNKTLLDGYNAISSHTLLVSTDVLKSPKDKTLLQQYVIKLINNGVLFRIALDAGSGATKLPAICINQDESLVELFPEYYSGATIKNILKNHNANALWIPTKSEMRIGYIEKSFSQIQVTGEKGIFVFPRKKQNGTITKVVLHLLNRDYQSSSKNMSPKGPFQISVSKAIFGKSHVTGAILHQPILHKSDSSTGVDESEKLRVKEDAANVIITVPKLTLWGIIEIISN